MSLDGQFVHLATKAHGYIRVEEIALFEIGFFITSGQFDITAGDFLDISFHLDDVKWSFIELRVIVTEVKDEIIDAEFFNPPPYAKNLGFYLMG